MNLAKSNLILAGAAALLAVLTTIVLVSDRELFTDVSAIPLMFEGFTEENVARIVLAVPKTEQPDPPANADPSKPPQIQYDKVILQRTDKGFVLGQGMAELTGARANEQMVHHHVFKHLNEIPANREAVIVKNATDEQLAEYDLNLEKAFIVQCFNATNQVIAELCVGRPAKKGGKESLRGMFLRKADSQDVYLYEDTQFWQRNVDPQLWVDRDIFRMKEGTTLLSLSVRNEHTADKPIVFAKQEGHGVWTVENAPAGKGAPRQSEVERFVQVANYMNSAQIMGPLQGKNLAGLGLYPGKLEIGLTYKRDGVEHSLTIWSGDQVEDRNEHYLRTSDSEFLMTWPSHLPMRFDRPFDDLFDPAPGAGDKDGEPGDQPGDKPGDKPGKKPADQGGEKNGK